MRTSKSISSICRALQHQSIKNSANIFADDDKLIERELRIAATAFETQVAMLITDADQKILRVNCAFSELSGYAMDELIGETPKIFRTNFHDPEFYADAWNKINHEGFWRGEVYTRRKNGETFPVWLSMTAVRSDDGTITNYVMTHSDISQRKAAEKEIEELAYYDALTKLANRRLFLDRLQKALDTSIRTNTRGALFFIDLDNFKTLNDTAGHEVGDKLLQQVAKRLLACVNEKDTVARLGGDEFVVILADTELDIEKAAKFTQTIGDLILSSLNSSYDLDGYIHYSSPSIGVAFFGEFPLTVTELLSQADLAMYHAKTSGKNALRYFDPAMRAAVTARSQLESAMRLGLQNKEFTLHYQPQISCDEKLIGAEALVRWQHPERGLLSPSEFIPIAEESGLIIPLGYYILETACLQMVEWAKGYGLSDFTMSVNVSARQIRQTDFVKQVLATIQRAGLDAKMLKLELTESLLVENVEETILKMTELKTHGVGFSLDDFGTGYSSLSYLKRLPLDQLKLDKSFVRDVLVDPNDAAIAKMILALGKSLGLNVIAEGVETDEQRLFLLEHGCNAYQGYFFGRPMDTMKFESYLWNFCKNRKAGTCARPRVICQSLAA